MIEERKKGFISNSEQIALVNCLGEFLHTRFGLNPTRDNYSSVAKSTILLFPSLNVKTSTIGGIVSFNSFKIKKKCIVIDTLFSFLKDLLYNGKSGGSLYVKMKNIRAALKPNPVEEIVADEAVEEFEDEIGGTAKNDVAILKTTIVKPENMDIIKEKLRKTVNYRLKMLENKEIDLLENFPYFFTNAELVSNSLCPISNSIFFVLFSFLKLLLLLHKHTKV